MVCRQRSQRDATYSHRPRHLPTEDKLRLDNLSHTYFGRHIRALQTKSFQPAKTLCWGQFFLKKNSSTKKNFPNIKKNVYLHDIK